MTEKLEETGKTLEELQESQPGHLMGMLLKLPKPQVSLCAKQL